MTRASRLALGLSLGVGLAAVPALTAPRDTNQPPGACRGKLGAELFIAVGRGNLSEVQTLLKRGADPNARNGLEFTPLFIAAATGQNETIETLLAAGAKVDAATPYGTPLTFAVFNGIHPTLQLLLARGADPNPARGDSITALMLAARAGDSAGVAELLRRKCDPNARDNDGATALTYAAREGRPEAARGLLEAGVVADQPDRRGWTPLMHAAVNGHAEVVCLLLDRGAVASRRESKGRTALQLAAAYGDHPDVLHALLKTGLPATEVRAAREVADRKGHVASARALGGPASLEPPVRTPREAARLGLKRLEISMLEFSRRTGCVSCHHEGFGRMATGAAREVGFSVAPALRALQEKRVSGMALEMAPLHRRALKEPAAMLQLPLSEIEKEATGHSWILAGMVAEKQPPTPEIVAMTMVLARQQSPEGFWHFALPRVPMQSSFFTTTALSVYSMRRYGGGAHQAEVDERTGRALRWLQSAPAPATEDRAFRLLGLKWAGAGAEDLRRASAELLALKRADGGWSQTPDLQSDAYATGQALYALHVGGGMPTRDPVYHEGVRRLLRAQDEDGSWFVDKRALPLNNYFDAAFPHGESQYSSFNGTAWATMALLQTMKDRPSAAGALPVRGR